MLRPTSLQQKLMLIVLSTTLVALVIASVAFTWLDVRQSRQEIISDLYRTGELVAAVIMRELEEEGTGDIPATIASLAADPAILRACLYNQDGVVQQSYQMQGAANQPEQTTLSCPDFVNLDRHQRTNSLAAVFPVDIDGRLVATLFIEGNSALIQERLRRFMLLSIAITLASMILGYVLAERLKNILMNPVNNLYKALDRIISNKDYSIRAHKTGEDELGALVDLFNTLLSTIESEHRSLKDNEALFRKLATFSPVGIFQVSIFQQLQYVNQRWRDMHQIHEERPELERWFSAISSSDQKTINEAWKRLIEHQESITLDLRLTRKDNTELWVHLMAGPLHDHDGAVIGYLGAVSDISELKAAHLQMEQLAFYDPLTGLANRRLFKNRLAKAIKAAHRNHCSMALMYLDMDLFKRVNDTLGHDVGDHLLQEVAHRLSSNVRDKDTVSRIGGDEFTILLTDVHQTSDVLTVAEKLLAALNKPINIKGNEIITSFSIGITMTPEDSCDPNTLMKNADLAMYRAKELGRNNFQFFSPDMNQAILEHLHWENDIQDAINLGQFVLYYQPKVKTDDLSITGVEALLRWIHPEKGLISPDRFIPIAEEAGQIRQIGHQVLDMACHEIGKLIHKGLLAPTSRVAVNLSARQFNDPDLANIIRGLLTSHGLPPGNLELEITESTLMKDVEKAIQIMKELRSIGVRFAIDDFGTGYSSLSYLKRFPVEVLKVDRTFVTDIPNDDNDVAITAAVIAMAHKLGITVVAEGVETADQLDFLRRNRCEECQGYLFSRPLPLKQLEHFLREADLIENQSA